MRRSPLSSQGKKSKLWAKVRREWVALNPPDHQGGYLCGICAKWVHKSEMELDHIISRAKAPQSFADLSNLQPTHSYCNQLKGGRLVSPKVSLEEYELRKYLNL
jgi:5-methylcytosine-specific restriction endonuclease McrA